MLLWSEFSSLIPPLYIVNKAIYITKNKYIKNG